MQKKIKTSFFYICLDIDEEILEPHCLILKSVYDGSEFFFITKIKDCSFSKWYQFVYFEEVYLIFWRNTRCEKHDHFLECDSVTKAFPFSRTILLHFSNFIFSYIPILFNRISKARSETRHAHAFPYSYAPETMLFNRSLSVKKTWFMLIWRRFILHFSSNYGIICQSINIDSQVNQCLLAPSIRPSLYLFF